MRPEPETPESPASPASSAAPPEDVFAPSAPADDTLHPHFRLLRDSPLFAPARDVLRDMCAGSAHCRRLVEALRTPTFDSALFDVSLFAIFSAAGHCVSVRQRHPRFLIGKDGATAAVDTVSAPPDPEHPAGAGLGGALFLKLQEHPWQADDASGKPLILAVEDSRGGEEAGVAGSAAMLHFLFGNVRGLKPESHAAASHEMARMFPNGFFSQVESENISAVLLCHDHGTLAKFNRIGQEGSHHAKTVKMLRHGHCEPAADATSTASPFLYEVGQREDAHESWNEGTMLIHNPFARHPLPRGWLGASAEVELKDGAVVCTFSGAFHPLASVTETMPGDTPAWWMEMRANLIAREMANRPK